MDGLRNLGAIATCFEKSLSPNRIMEATRALSQAVEMLVFVDESGDLGYKLGQGSSAFFTIAFVVFAGGETALPCQRAIEDLRRSMRLPDKWEFHFTSNSRNQRLAFLQTVAAHDFQCYTFTLDKASSLQIASRFAARELAYEWVCRTALENVGLDLDDATIVVDGSGERAFRQQLKTYLQRHFNTATRRSIQRVRVSRSESDPLVQLADYVAGVTNRLFTRKHGADEYEQYLRRKRATQCKWP